MDGYIGEIRLFPYGFSPQNWLQCNGWQVPISTYPVLATLLGATYGPLTAQTFTLPNLTGRAVIGAGKSLAPTPVTPYILAQASGVASVTLDGGSNGSGIPAHAHKVVAEVLNQNVATAMTATPDPTCTLSKLTHYNTTGAASFDKTFAPVNTTAITALNSATVSPVGSTQGNVQSHENRQPFLALNYCICYDGAFPTPPTQDDSE